MSENDALGRKMVIDNFRKSVTQLASGAPQASEIVRSDSALANSGKQRLRLDTVERVYL
ncbi:MAG TPA: hypothetical protein VK335_10580 [Bryobacteraceae bacterium]|nr:hypothetical protein [Bryobacteraceae bacterium]